MKSRTIVATLALALAAAFLNAAEPDSPQKTALDRFRALEGEWISAEDTEFLKKGDLTARYHATGGGSAIIEEIFPGTPHAMTTVYHLDGKDLVLTHYCMSGNQPRMRAKVTDPARLKFDFDGGTNLDANKDTHMHEATFEFVGPNEIRSSWRQFVAGKPETTVNMHLVRKTS